MSTTNFQKAIVFREPNETKKVKSIGTPRNEFVVQDLHE